MRYYIIAGEASGDTYGGLLMAAIKSADSDAEFRFWGGPQMLEQSAGQAMDYRKTAFMGFYEVLKNIGTIKKLFTFCKKDIQAFQPDRVIFIDYPGFNLRMAKWAHDLGFHCSYFVAPQIWAWKKSRYKKIKANLDQLFVILPFEKEFYKELGLHCEYFGHPLADIIEAKERKTQLPAELQIAVLPGSRKQELEKHLPVIEALVKLRPQDQFQIAIAPGLEKADLAALIDTSLPNLHFHEGKTDEVIRKADVALSKSGTSTLETALIETPQIVFYKTSPISYSIGKRIVKLDFISLVNIIAGKEVVTELIQDEFNPARINQEIEKLMEVGQLNKMIDGYHFMRAKLSGTQIFEKIASKIFAGTKDIRI